MLAQDVRRALRPEILPGPPLVLVVPVDAVQQERQPADATLGERDLEAGELPHRMAPEQVLDGENRHLGGEDHVLVEVDIRQVDRIQTLSDVQTHHHVEVAQRGEDGVPGR